MLNLACPTTMKDFYDEMGLPRGRNIGGNFNGPDLDKLMRDPALTDLVYVLDEAGIANGMEIAEYLRSLRDLYAMCVSKELPEDWSRAIDEFSAAFHVCHQLELVSWTPKCHIALTHIREYIELTGRSLYCADTSPTGELMLL